MKLISKTIYLRLAEETDADFIYSLRIDDSYNKYLSSIDGTVEKQREWLKQYKEREKRGEEYYFIIHRISDSKQIGTVRVYDFIKEENSFCWGSWILNKDKTRYAALECALLIYDFAFETLGYTRCHMNIRKENTKVINFHKRFGVKIVGESELDLYGHYFVDDYLKISPAIKDIVENNS
jgi:RimJ/RimL family protein N-acetyltransferase